MGKDVQYGLPLEKWNLKLQWDVTTHLPEWLKFKMVVITNACKHAEKLDHSYIPGGDVK